jgi:hypothetical protein
MLLPGLKAIIALQEFWLPTKIWFEKSFNIALCWLEIPSTARGLR